MEHNIIKLIQEGKTKLALKDFIGFLDELKEIDKSARIIHANHKELENQKIEGTVDENETTWINKINKRVINLHEELENLIQDRFEVQKIEISEESFLERLRRGDVFVLGGDKYEFLYAKGMVAYVKSSIYRPPTIPRWFSDMLPLSFDLAKEIGRFRRLVKERFNAGYTKQTIMDFFDDYLYVDDNSKHAL